MLPYQRWIQSFCAIRPYIDTMKKLHDNLAGTFRRFGVLGPVYEILSPLRKANAKGGKMYKIRVPESGEVAVIDAEAILADPVAD